MSIPFPLHSFFSATHAANHPVCHDGRHLVHWQTCRDRIAGITQALGQRHEARWLIASSDTLHFTLLLFALLHAGKQVVIPPNTQPGTLAQLSQIAFDAIAQDELLNTKPSDARLTPLESDKAIIDLYTSGSTGVPKKVRKTLTQFQTEVATLESLWKKNLDDSHIIATVPHHHIYGLLFRIFWPLSTGRIFDAITCTYPDILSERLSLFKNTTLVSSPAHLSRLSSLLTLDTMAFKPRHIFSSGGALQSTVATELSNAFGYFPIEVFGSTETGGIAWRTQDKDAAWTLLPGMKIAHDAEGHPFLHSPHLHDDAPWKMDDAINMMEDGRFMLGGRLDRIVKIEEKRLSLSDMESQLLAHPWIESAATLALTGRRQSVGAALVLSDEGKALFATRGKKEMIAHLRAHLAQSFEPVLLPRHWRFIDILPMNERGKLSMQALAALFNRQERESDSAPLHPLILQIENGKEHAVRLSLHIPRDLAHFKGHFPELPILPGVVQVDWAVHYGRQYLNIAGHFKAVEHLRFQSIILPETILDLLLEFTPSRNTLDFSMANAQRKFSSGRIVFSEAA
ncbi:MAG: AMP-dependent synthetase [Oxalobacter sp.]|nr:MAG: AMP-dependent synthetase [Oxalobacter sp.]